jgi:hypothetical protein
MWVTEIRSADAAPPNVIVTNAATMKLRFIHCLVCRIADETVRYSTRGTRTTSRNTARLSSGDAMPAPQSEHMPLRSRARTAGKDAQPIRIAATSCSFQFPSPAGPIPR